MAPQALYRRFRPGSFAELRGQEAVVQTLRNAVTQNKVSHAYLFSGPRGTGKTSTARILAKALNCTSPSDTSEPCGSCASCVSITHNTSYDLIELDAASNNKVDDVRDLISKVAVGSPGKVKVYVLDEVHMLTSGAENALLKTLEEPPDHVIFVLCTTEPHKVVPTIRSRTQHLEFNLIDGDVLADHARWVIQQAELDISKDGIESAVSRGAGSARDTLSALEQIVAAGGVTNSLDAVDTIIEALATQDCGPAFVAVNQALRSGREPRIIGETVLARLRDAFLAAMGADLSHLTDAQQAAAQITANQIPPAGLTRALEVLGTALVDMRQAPDPRIDLEVALGRLTNRHLDSDSSAILERLERLERNQGAVTNPSPPTNTAAGRQPTSPNAAAQQAAPQQSSRLAHGAQKARAALTQAQNKTASTQQPTAPTTQPPKEPAQPPATKTTPAPATNIEAQAPTATAPETTPETDTTTGTETKPDTQHAINQVMEVFPGAELVTLDAPTQQWQN